MWISPLEDSVVFTRCNIFLHVPSCSFQANVCCFLPFLRLLKHIRISPVFASPLPVIPEVLVTTYPSSNYSVAGFLITLGGSSSTHARCGYLLLRLTATVHCCTSTPPCKTAQVYLYSVSSTVSSTAAVPEHKTLKCFSHL